MNDNPKKNDENLSGQEWWKQHLYGSEQKEDPNQQYWNGISDHGMRKNGDPNYGPIPEEYESNAMSKTAFTCGVISLICIVLSVIFPGAAFVVGAIGILFALLSRRKKLSRQARAAIIMCSVSMASFLLMMLLSIAVLVSTGTWGFMIEKVRNLDMNDPNAAAELQQELLDELMRRMGVTAEDLKNIPGYEAAGISDAAKDAPAEGASGGSGSQDSGSILGTAAGNGSQDSGSASGASGNEDDSKGSDWIVILGEEASAL